MDKLLITPLRDTNYSVVIVIDALDECEDEGPESALLLELERSILHLPKVKFFITSCPEPYIATTICRPLLQRSTDVCVLHEAEPRAVNDDICRFFRHELSRLALRRRINDWPTEEQLDSLCRRADGFFLYALATVKFLDHCIRDPSTRLITITESPENTSYEGKTKLEAYGSLDSLYISSLQKTFREMEAEDYLMVNCVLRVAVLAVYPLSPSSIATLADLSLNEVQRILELVQWFLFSPGDPSGPVRLFHKSFSDFITDPDRCTDSRFHVPPNAHADLFLCCVEVMCDSLKKNMCSIPSHVLNSDVEDLQERLAKSGIRGGLEYACRSWYKHLVLIETEDRNLEVLSALRNLLHKKFVFWLEVLSVLGAVGDAARALTATLRWLNEVCPFLEL